MENTSQVALLLTEQIRIVGKKQLEIAEEAGFEHPNVITMIKQGRTKLPLAKVGLVAKALEMDPIYLLKLCIEEYQPETWEAIRPLLDEMVTQDELQIIKAFRKSIGAPYLSALNKEQRSRLDAYILSMQNEVFTIQ